MAASIEKLRAGPELFRRIVETTNEGVVVVDTAGVIFYMNARMAGMLGCTQEEALGRPCWDFAFDRARMEDELRPLLSGTDAVLDVQLRRSDGSRRDALISVNGLSDAAGGHVGALAMVVDVTERRQVEAALRRSQAQLAEAQRLSHVGSWEWDVVANTLEWSDEHYDLFGVSRGSFEPTIEGAIDVIHPASRDQVRRSLEQALVDKRPFEQEYEVVRPDGTRRTMHAFGRVVVDERGRAVRVFGTAQDISERIAVKARLREYGDRTQALARQLMSNQEAERRHLARELHDELGQILAAIGVRLFAARKATGEAVEVQLGEAAALVEEAGKKIRSMALELRPAMLDALGLRPALEWLAERFHQKAHLRVQFEASMLERPLPPEISIACFRVVQEALTNVVRHARTADAWVRLVQTRDSLELSVRDEGAGFDLAGVQARSTAASAFGLLGMSERVQLVGGTFNVDSGAERGTRIEATFPL